MSSDERDAHTPKARQTIELRRALQIAGSRESTTWLLRPYLERKALVLMIGAEGTYKSFLALHWGMQVAAAGESVVYLSAEGRGLSKRLRAWCKVHAPSSEPKAWIDTLTKLPFFAIEKPVNLSDADTLVTLQTAIDAHCITPALIVVDTLTRNSDGLVERSNEDFLAFLNLVDHAVRGRYGSTVLLIHHVGHADGTRARGPSALSQATDANFLLARPDPLKRTVTVRSGRMKDCEPPAPFEIEGEVVTLEEVDDDGKPETSLAIRFTGAEPAMKPLKPTGKAQRALLAELERLDGLPGAVGVWTLDELRGIARDLGFHKSSARDAVLGLQTLGHLTPTIGGSRLTVGTKGTKRDESTNSSKVVGTKRGDERRDPLGSVPSSLRSDPSSEFDHA